MALKNTTLIRFPRCKYIASSRQTAMLHLMEDFTHVVGQPVIVGYYKNLDQTEIDTIVAMGIKNGKGKDCFKVVTTGQFILVWDIVYSLPDVSSLVHGEIYLYNDPVTNVWYTVTLNETNMSRDIDPITEDPKFYIRLTDNTIWVSDSDLVVRPLSGIYTKKEVDDIIEQIKIDTDFSRIEEKLNTAVEKSNYASEKVDVLEERIEEIEEGTRSIEIISNIHSAAIVNLIRIYGEPTSQVWYGKNDRRVFETDSIEFEPIFKNYDGEEIKTGFDRITVAVGDEPETEVEPNEFGYYTNPMSIILPPGRDIEVPIKIAITYKGVRKTCILTFYGLSEFKYIGRVEKPEEIDLTSLTQIDIDKYVWNNLKSTSDVKINSGENLGGYFVYLYPESWGDLTNIGSNGLIYYTPFEDICNTSTFKKKTIIIDETNFLCYYYRNINREEANNVNFI